MFCNHCGSKLEGNTQFCPNCGKPVNAAPEALPKQPTSFFAPAMDLADTTLRPRPSAPVAPAPNFAPAESAPVSACARPAVAAPAAQASPVEAAPVAYARPTAPAPAYIPAEAIPATAYEKPAPYPSEAPTVAESAAVEAPSVIRRPPVMAPRPKKKKSGLLWVWVIVALLVAGLVGVSIWGFVDGWLPELFSGSGTSNSGDEGEEDEDPYADWNEFEIDGLIVYLPEGFEKEENRGRITAFYRESRTDYVEIEVEHDTVEELSADIEDAEDLADYYIDEIEADDDVVLEYETMNGVPYVIFSREDDPEDVMVLGFYSDGEMYWVLCAENFDPDDVEEIVPYITSGKVKKSPDDWDDAQDKKDSDTGRNKYELNGLLIYLPDEFDEGDSDENVAFFSGDDVEIRIESMPMSEESIRMQTIWRNISMTLSTIPMKMKLMITN